MAKHSVSKQTEINTADINVLIKENEALRAQLASLRHTKKTTAPHRWRNVFAGLSATIAVVTFSLWNIGYWTRQTIVDTDSFVAATAPLIKDSDIQTALKTEITDQIFSRVNVEEELTKALPENLTFIAAPFAAQVRNFADAQVGKALASDQAAQVWEQTLTVSHKKILGYLDDPSKDSTISLSEVYNFAGSKLQDGKAGFLFGKTLPPNVGNITVKELKNVDKARTALETLNRTVYILAIVSLTTFVLALVLSTRRRNMLVGMGLFTIVFMLSTLAALQFGQMQISQAVVSANASAAEAAFSIITEALRVQTLGVAALIAAGLGVALVVSEWSVMVWLRGLFRKGLDWIVAKLPDFSLPTFVAWIAINKVVIGWTLVAVNFIVFAFRMPPTQTGAVNALVASAIVVLVLESISALYRRFSILRSA